MLPWTLKLYCKPYITYALLVYDLFSVEETAMVLKLVVEHWSYASSSHSSMFIKPVLVLNFSGALCFPSVWNLLLPSQLIPSFLEEEFLKAGIWIPLEGLCSALRGLLQLVHLAVTGWVSLVESPSSNFGLQNWQRVMELTQSLQGLDVLFFWCPASLLRSWQIPSFLLEAWSYSRQGAST